MDFFFLNRDAFIEVAAREVRADKSQPTITTLFLFANSCKHLREHSLGTAEQVQPLNFVNEHIL